MPIGAIITLVLAGLAIIGFTLYFLVVRGRLLLPSGEIFTAGSAGFKTTVVIKSKISVIGPNALAARCCQINSSAQAAFSSKNFVTQAILERCKEIVVYFMDDDTYNESGGKRWRSYYAKTGAYISKCGKKFSSDYVPMACIRIKCIDKIRTSGEPLIHELCHAYLDDYAADSEDHSDPRVWFAAGGETSAQGLARAELLKAVTE